ncbi:MAG: site-specific integrase [Acidimicrobiales bacterium]|nr:site-specific integrase [Acidimicrobiales bacterium]
MAAQTTVDDLLRDWFAAVSPNWSPTTVRQNRSIVDRHLSPKLGGHRLSTLRTEDIDLFYGQLRRSGGRGGHSLTAGTVHRIHVVLHGALAQALRWEWLWVNPATNASAPRCEPTAIYPPSPEDVNRLLDHVARVNPDFHAFLSLAVSTGARRSQLTALRWSDEDLDRGQIGFLRALLDAPGGPVLRPTKTGRTYRVHLDAASRDVFVRHYRRATRRAQNVNANLDRTSFVFSHEPAGGSPWSPNWVTNQFIAFREQAGVSFRLHDLRHFMATMMLTAGIPITTVSARLSHARTSTTLNVYAHAIPGGDQYAADALRAILDRTQASPDGMRRAIA